MNSPRSGTRQRQGCTYTLDWSQCTVLHPSLPSQGIWDITIGVPHLLCLRAWWQIRQLPKWMQCFLWCGWTNLWYILTFGIHVWLVVELGHHLLFCLIVWVHTRRVPALGATLFPIFDTQKNCSDFYWHGDARARPLSMEIFGTIFSTNRKPFLKPTLQSSSSNNEVLT